MEQLRPRAGAQRHRWQLHRDDVLIVERVSGEDVDDVLPLFAAYCAFYGTDPGEDALRSLCDALVADPEHEGMQFVARDLRGRAIGFATVYWLWSSTRAVRVALMNDLYVSEHARGSGAGEALIGACAGAARERGCASLQWQTAPDNERAQRLYDRLGAQRSTWLTYDLPL